MITAKLALCAEIIVTDANSNALSAINILDDMTPEGYPFLFQKINFLVVSHKAPEDPKVHDVTIKISINEKIIFTTPSKIDFLEKDVHRFVWGIGGLLISEPGILKFELSGATIPSTSYQMKCDLVQPKELSKK